MDNGPFRMGNSASTARGTGGRVPSRQELERPVSTEEEAPRKAPVHHRGPASHPAEPGSSKKKWFVVGGSIAVLLVVAGLVAWLLMGRSATTAIDSSKYQAVFFTNGQVYFGKLQAFNTEYMKLTDIYYLQSQQSGTEQGSKNPQQTTTSDQSNVQLIKLGDEIHGPQDEMILSKDQVLFYENLKSDGKVSQSIEKHKSSK